MAREARGDRHPLIRSMAREERKGLAWQALREQTFALLWDRFGTGDDDDQALAWRWFNLWAPVSAAMTTVPKRERTPRAVAEAAADLIGGDDG